MQICKNAFSMSDVNALEYVLKQNEYVKNKWSQFWTLMQTFV